MFYFPYKAEGIQLSTKKTVHVLHLVQSKMYLGHKRIDLNQYIQHGNSVHGKS